MKLVANSGNRHEKKPTYRKSPSGSKDAREQLREEKADPTKKDSLSAAEGPKNEKHAAAADDSSGITIEERKSPEKKDVGADRRSAEKHEGDTERDSGAKHAAHAKGSSKKPAQDAKPSKLTDDEKRVLEAFDGDGKDGAADKAKTPDIPAKRKRPLGIIAAACVLAVLVVVGVGLGIASQQGPTGEIEAPANLDFSDTQYNESGELINPVDWDEWTTRNPNVYAWLQVEDTNVDYPILQHPVVDDYYLMRNIDGEPEVNGTLYTQVAYNSKDFEEDPVTVIYGHTFEQADTMFTTLHNYEDPEFFATHPYFYIYTPEERLEYEVVSAFEYDNSHILMTNDMSDPDVRAQFFQMVQAPNSINQNVRDLDGRLDPEKDHLLILSTCTQPANDNARYLIVAVLKNVEKTENVELPENSNILEETFVSADDSGEMESPEE